MDKVIKLLPFKYIHVLDLNKNVTLIEIGPQTYTCLSDKRIVYGPESMIIVPPNSYCVIENPVVRNDKGEVVVDKYGQAVLRYTELEIRLSGEPFPLYPGEVIRKNCTPLQLLSFNEALHLRAIRDVEIDDPQQLCNRMFIQNNEEKELSEPFDKITPAEDETTKGEKEEEIIQVKPNKVLKKAGEEWYFVGPGHYIPNVSVEVVRVEVQRVIEPGTALKIRANRDLYDNYYQKFRKHGEIWLLKEPGSYLKHVYEEILSVEKPHLITEKTAIRLRAIRDFVDDYNITRHVGDEYLITTALTNSHLNNVNEEFVAREDAIILNNRQFAIILNPYSHKQKKFLLGKRKIVRGPKIFFLQPPYEEQESAILNVVVLSPSEMISLKAKEAFYDRISSNNSNQLLVPAEQNAEEGDEEDDVPLEVKANDKKNYVLRKPGDNWYVYGPGEFWPILEATYKVEKAALYLGGGNLCIYHTSTLFIVPIFALLLYWLISRVFL